MRRAYPQFMAAGGEDLPRDVLTVIFPLALLGSDPQVFRGERPRSLSGRGAGRPGIDVRRRHQVACQRVRPDAADAVDGAIVRAEAQAPLLVEPAHQTRSEHPDGDGALRRRSSRSSAACISRWPSYNAGAAGPPVDGRASGLDADEFIDDIPYPETQNYVKRILGTAEDYRRLYGSRIRRMRTALEYAPDYLSPTACRS